MNNKHELLVKVCNKIWYTLKIIKRDKDFNIPNLTIQELSYLNKKYDKILKENNFKDINDMIDKWFIFEMEIVS